MQTFRLTILAVAAIMLASLPAAATERFDGSWRIDIIGKPGQCELGYRVPVRINGGLVSYKGRRFSTAAVYITPAGTVAIKLVSGRHVVTGTGALKGHFGSGSWTLRSIGCTGRWRAEKQ